jgi:predicted transcriptional regulator
MKGIYTLEKIQKERDISKQAAINLISRLRKKGFVKTSGGGKQIRLYKISDKPLQEDNGMYSIINKYTPIKLAPSIMHIVYGKKYTVEQTIVDCLKKNDSRHSLAAVFLLNNIRDWKKLNKLIIEHKLESKFNILYNLARENVRVKKMPAFFEKDLSKSKKKIHLDINKFDITGAR